MREVINITYEFLFAKDLNEGYKHIVSIDKRGLVNPLYGKEIYFPGVLERRNLLFQALGYVGCYANNHYDSTIDYVFLDNGTVDALSFGMKNDAIRKIERICEEKRSKLEKWKFNIKFILESDTLDFLRAWGERVGESELNKLILKY
ncbi:MAG: hypothetical protein ACLUWB_18475 [Parabacteroides distasonis]|jgi:hypothetical protein